MRVPTLFALSVAALLLAACTASAPAAEQPVAVNDSGCATPESGLIKPQSTGMPNVPLTGPILIKSLNVGVDPANPQTFGSVMWSKGNTWFGINDFKGPFYLAEGETLSAEVGKSPWNIIYFGCRLE